ncbi:unnamed protein product [Cercospora beticola]|nr:unnamed protein product [Cercospora beticola]
MPKWCIDGYDLVVAFEAAAALSGSSPGPEERTYSFVYPWEGSYRDPHTAACSIKSWVCTQVESWTEEATKTLPGLPREVVEQVNQLVEKVTLGEISGEWKPRTSSAEEQQLLEYMQGSNAVQALGLVWNSMKDEVVKRVGPEAASNVMGRTTLTVLAEKQRSGEWPEMSQKILDQLG